MHAHTENICHWEKRKQQQQQKWNANVVKHCTSSTEHFQAVRNRDTQLISAIKTKYTKQNLLPWKKILVFERFQNFTSDIVYTVNLIAQYGTTNVTSPAPKHLFLSEWYPHVCKNQHQTERKAIIRNRYNNLTHFVQDTKRKEGRT